MKAIKILMNLLIAIILLTSATLLAQVKKDTTKTMHKAMKHDHQMMHDSSSQHHMQDMKMMKDSALHSKMMDKKETMMKKDSSKSMNMEMKGMDMGHNKMMDKDKKKSPLIREGEIDLNAIDENKDGKVFQDQMDFNVISDKPGECPICGMNLKEVTLQQAKENLLKHNFKVKNGVEQK